MMNTPQIKNQLNVGKSKQIVTNLSQSNNSNPYGLPNINGNISMEEIKDDGNPESNRISIQMIQAHKELNKSDNQPFT